MLTSTISQKITFSQLYEEMNEYVSEYLSLPIYSNDSMVNAILRPTNLGINLLVECLIEDFAAMEN